MIRRPHGAIYLGTNTACSGDATAAHEHESGRRDEREARRFRHGLAFAHEDERRRHRERLECLAGDGRDAGGAELELVVEPGRVLLLGRVLGEVRVRELNRTTERHVTPDAGEARLDRHRRNRHDTESVVNLEALAAIGADTCGDRAVHHVRAFAEGGRARLVGHVRGLAADVARDVEVALDRGAVPGVSVDAQVCVLDRMAGGRALDTEEHVRGLIPVVRAHARAGAVGERDAVAELHGRGLRVRGDDEHHPDDECKTCTDHGPTPFAVAPIKVAVAIRSSNPPWALDTESDFLHVSYHITLLLSIYITLLI
jgi:hypothetical protein